MACCWQCDDDLARAALRGDPLALKLVHGQSGAIAGLTNPHTVDEVDAEVDRVDGVAKGIDANVQRCYAIGTPKRTEWDALYASWQAFAVKHRSIAWDPLLGPLSGPLLAVLGSDYDTAQQFERQFADFSTRAAADGCAAMPKVTPRADREDETREGILSAMKWGAAAVIAVAVVYGVTRVL